MENEMRAETLSQQKALNFNAFISNATRQNWRRLGLLDENKVAVNQAKFSTNKFLANKANFNANKLKSKLTTRANKKLSTKFIIPTEYFCNAQNIAKIQGIVEYISLKNYTISNALYSLGLNLLQDKNLAHKPHTKKVLSDYAFECHSDLLALTLPNDESDILGLIYQCLLSEGEKNIAGAYYTPKAIVWQMTKGLDFSKKQKFLDPACGSGAFLLGLQNANPSQIYGIDNDYIAVFIAKINLLLKFKDDEFIPQIYCADFLNENEMKNLPNKFDYIITNPPWGASTKPYKNAYGIASNETFSLFLLKAYHQLKEKGIVRFLLPSAFLNVKTHKDIRQFILQNANLKSICFYSNNFEGVSTSVVDISLQKSAQNSHTLIKKDGDTLSVPLSAFKQTQNYVFSVLDKQDIKIISQVKQKSEFDLSASIWALGIVTGDNKKALHKSQIQGSEKIYTGKEITPYRLKKAVNFILYDRAKFQQVAKDSIYRSDEKLVYKFISNKLVFAYDDSGALFLNSANILIPQIPTISIKATLAFLNSPLYQYLYLMLFNEIKILKGNLLELPFPRLSKEQNYKITALVEQILRGNDECIYQVKQEIYKVFDINKKQQEHIEKVLNAKTH